MNAPKIIEGSYFVDDRGYLSFLKDFSWVGKIKRFYIVENHDNYFIRAWHGHNFEEKYVYVLQGAALVGAVPMANSCVEGSPKEFVLSARVPQVLHIPAGYYNGFMNLEPDTKNKFWYLESIKTTIDNNK